MLHLTLSQSHIFVVPGLLPVTLALDLASIDVIVPGALSVKIINCTWRHVSIDTVVPGASSFRNHIVPGARDASIASNRI